MADELRKAGLAVEQRRSFRITYDCIVASEYVADLIVERVLLIELEAVNVLIEKHHAQCINFLKAAGLRLGFLLNVDMKLLEIKRAANTV